MQRLAVPRCVCKCESVKMTYPQSSQYSPKAANYPMIVTPASKTTGCLQRSDTCSDYYHSSCVCVSVCESDQWMKEKSKGGCREWRGEGGHTRCSLALLSQYRTADLLLHCVCLTDVISSLSPFPLSPSPALPPLCKLFLKHLMFCVTELYLSVGFLSCFFVIIRIFWYWTI